MAFRNVLRVANVCLTVLLIIGEFIVLLQLIGNGKRKRKGGKGNDGR